MSNLSFKLSADNHDFTKEMEATKASVGNVKKEMRSLTQETNNLEVAYRKLSNEEKNSPFGKYLRQEIDNNIGKLADFKDAIGDVQENVNKLASDTAVWDGMAEAINVSRDVVSAFATSLGISTKEGGLAADAINMLARAQTFANAAISIGNALQKQSKIMSAITTLQMRAQAAATGQATIAQKAFNIVANANPYVLLTTAIIGLVSALALFASGSDEATEEQERLQQEMEETKRKAEEQRNTFLGAAATHHSDAEALWSLYRSYKTANSEIEKTAILSDAASMFKKLGIEINSTADAERILTNQISTATQLMKLQGDAAGVSALRMEKFKQSMAAMMKNGYTTSVASSLASAAVSDLDKELNRINSEIASKKKQLGIKDNTFKSPTSSRSGSTKTTKNEIDYEKESLEDYEKQLSKVQEKLKKKNLLKVDVDKAKAEILRLESQIKNKKIELGFEQPDPKDIPGTEAWYQEQIKDLENMKAKLPLDAYIEREQIQQQIDNLHLKVKLETEGVTVTGSQAIADAWAGKTEKSVKSVEEAISALNQKLQETDWSKLEPGAHTLDDYISKIQDLKNELVPLENMILSPLEKAEKKLQKQQEIIQSVGAAVQATGELFNQLGNSSDNVNLKVMGIVAKAIATIALSFAQALSSCKKWWEWLAFGATGLSEMISMITSIKSVTAGAGAYANGGTVGYSEFGDKLLARVNSGEVILNKRQQQRAWELMDSGIGGLVVTSDVKIKGSDLYLSLKNYGKVQSGIGKNIGIK